MIALRFYAPLTPPLLSPWYCSFVLQIYLLTSRVRFLECCLLIDSLIMQPLLVVVECVGQFQSLSSQTVKSAESFLLNIRTFCSCWSLFRIITIIVGPGAYNIPGIGAESMRKAYIESTRRGVFGTTAVRIKPFTKRDSHELPGPSHYQIKQKIQEQRPGHLTSTFASTSTRLPDHAPVTIKVSTPAPKLNFLHYNFKFWCFFFRKIHHQVHTMSTRRLVSCTAGRQWRHRARAKPRSATSPS